MTVLKGGVTKVTSCHEKIFCRRVSARPVLAAGLLILLSVVGLSQQLQAPTLPTSRRLPCRPLRCPLLHRQLELRRKRIEPTRVAAIRLPSLVKAQTESLPASQIIAIVQARPELIVDIKQVMADYLEQQGNPVQVDSITDDMLYRGIASDAGLRAAISVWLRARGYVPESEFDRSDLDPKSSDDLRQLSLRLRSQLLNSLAGGATTETALTNPNRTQDPIVECGRNFG